MNTDNGVSLVQYLLLGPSGLDPQLILQQQQSFFQYRLLTF